MTRHQEERKQAFAASLTNLLRKEAIEKITVDQICEEANVHRSTFYRYFTDKYDLLEYVFKNIFVAQVDRSNVVESIIRHIASEKKIFRNVFNNNNKADYYLFGTILRIFSSQIYDAVIAGHLHEIPWIEIMVKNSKYPKIATDMIAGGFLTVLIEWISTNYEMDEEELARFILHIEESLKDKKININD